jgi:hypothetical protein
MSSTDKNRTTRQNRVRLVLAGMEKHLASTPSIVIEGVPHSVADMRAMLQKDIAVTDAADKARADWRTSVQAERDSHTTSNPVLSGIKKYVQMQFGSTQSASTTLADFGYAPRKPRVVTPKTQVAATAKALATRAARHTTGPKAKLAITGAVQPPASPAPGAVPAAPATPPATASPPAAPSPAAPAAPATGAPQRSTQ